MDGTHSTGCILIGLALTFLLVRLFWMSSPPFNQLQGQTRTRVKWGLLASVVVLTLTGSYYLGQPEDPVKSAEMAEEGFRFH